MATATRQQAQMTLSMGPLTTAERECLSHLSALHHVDVEIKPGDSRPERRNIIGFIDGLADALKEAGHDQLAEAMFEVFHQSTQDADFGGYGLSAQETLDEKQEAEVVFLVSAYLEALKSAARARQGLQLLTSRPDGRRGMTMTEKVFAMHDVSRRGWVEPGDIIQVDVDWILASELSWKVC